MTTTWKTAVIGATTNPRRYAYLAADKLNAHQFPMVLLGFKAGEVAGQPIVTDWPERIDQLKMITLYIGPARQPPFYDYILGLKPKKVIFNPGTENPELYALLDKAGIIYEEACTLVMLSMGVYSQGI